MLKVFKHIKGYCRELGREWTKHNEWAYTVVRDVSVKEIFWILKVYKYGDGLPMKAVGFPSLEGMRQLDKYFQR